MVCSPGGQDLVWGLVPLSKGLADEIHCYGTSGVETAALVVDNLQREYLTSELNDDHLHKVFPEPVSALMTTCLPSSTGPRLCAACVISTDHWSVLGLLTFCCTGVGMEMP